MEAVGAGGEPVSVQARFVVDASGRDAFIGTRKGTRKARAELDRTAIWSHWTGVTMQGGLEEGLSIIIYVGEEQKGWIWIFPLTGDRITAGTVMNNAYLREQKRELQSAGSEDWQMRPHVPGAPEGDFRSSSPRRAGRRAGATDLGQRELLVRGQGPLRAELRDGGGRPRVHRPDLLERGVPVHQDLLPGDRGDRPQAQGRRACGGAVRRRLHEGHRGLQLRSPNDQALLQPPRGDVGAGRRRRAGSPGAPERDGHGPLHALRRVLRRPRAVQHGSSTSSRTRSTSIGMRRRFSSRGTIHTQPPASRRKSLRSATRSTGTRRSPTSRPAPSDRTARALRGVSLEAARTPRRPRCERACPRAPRDTPAGPRTRRATTSPSAETRYALRPGPAAPRAARSPRRCPRD